MDFTLKTLRSLLSALHDSGYVFVTVKDFSFKQFQQSARQVILRHDVDKKPSNSLAVARLESELGIKGTYYFRILPDSLDEIIVREIASMGHEVGYHYEDVTLVVERQKIKVKRQKAGLYQTNNTEESRLAEMAFENFRKTLAKMREIVPIDTICMHGSPMSSYDSRILWKYYDYGDMGISAEPYFDFSFNEMLYLTDTGRRWNGHAVSIRDRGYNRGPDYYSGWVRKPIKGSAMAMSEQGISLQKRYIFKTTDELINAIKSEKPPAQLLITIHPQRWTDNFLEWMTELVSQTIKNPVKYLISKRVEVRTS